MNHLVHLVCGEVNVGVGVLVPLWQWFSSSCQIVKSTLGHPLLDQVLHQAVHLILRLVTLHHIPLNSDLPIFVLAFPSLKNCLVRLQCAILQSLLLFLGRAATVNPKVSSVRCIIR